MDLANYFRVDLNEVDQIFDISKLAQSDKLSNESILNAYKQMVLIRKFEERAGALYTSKKIAGFCHLYIGQEAIAVSNVLAANDGDSFITTYRDHGLMIATGSPVYPIMAELCGKADGCSKGKGGSMHMFDTHQDNKKKFFGGHGIVGAQTSLGTGIAFAEKYKGTKQICYTYLGDGAVHQGQFYESMNMASMWDLPVIYIIENNGYAMGTSVERATYDTNLFNRGIPFGILGKQVNGMNFFESYNAIKMASNYVREKQRPILLEMKTYRYRGHSMSDPAQYRTKAEVDNVKDTMDAIDIVKSYILEHNLWTQDEMSAYEKSKHQEMTSIAERCDDG